MVKKKIRNIIIAFVVSVLLTRQKVKQKSVDTIV